MQSRYKPTFDLEVFISHLFSPEINTFLLLRPRDMFSFLLCLRVFAVIRTPEIGIA
jgi:hypothetical protein